MGYRILGLLLGIFCLGFADASANPPVIPPVPTYYVLDETKILDQKTLQSLQALLIEHDRLTDEQFMLSIFQADHRDLPENWTHQVFETWRVGQRGKNNGILLSVFWKSRKAQMETGYGLEAILPHDKSDEILSEVIIPRLKQAHLKTALKLGVYRILEALNSPLIQSGKALEILGSTEVSALYDDLEENTTHSYGGFFLILLGIAVFLGILVSILSREAHFTRSGWFRVRKFPWHWVLNLKNRKMNSTQHQYGGVHGTW
jgi:uncharacterized membrane protein YgcG